MSRVARAWWILLTASAASTLIAAFAASGGYFRDGALIGLALLKAQIILSLYLDLRRAPAVLSGFMLAFGLWAMVLLVLLFSAGRS